MITLNGTEVTPKHFSDGALDVKIDLSLLNFEGTNTIKWLFDNNEELIVVYFLAKHLQNKGITDIELDMPYIINARKDRAQRDKDVFSLKYFAEIINSLNFKRVTVLDPHSIVSEALIDRIHVITPEKHIHSIIDQLGKDTIMFYPDEGAVKRYADKVGLPFVYGMKKRDTETRVIQKLQIEGDLESLKGKNVLMVDDICSSGKTLCIAAKELKDLGANNLYVYVSHCENTVLKSELLDIITELYTTDSIIRTNHPKIKIVSIDE